ncbi:unnamed protein product [Malassezia sympodialis ATCC 42132]|uniref:Similar to S.cerevisiae protein NAT1 (Subunit of protein N-terminal acetyltransferase NatA) n=1 Tax=Malassezia sympodialis (strain ATCC 42132) TaxID=1230383 RepID=M5E8H3_MALS4|nr:uncharacterized protein MSY001_1605 [Malassezia sympodialis ATCC 42132]CCU98899.1 unnamed protein product [Malassezia sympodialis ATCC 42132]SHO79009.1 Similar to S.cerevisiae protein NAT1 (Subunit of protein N-terminal acetyltransferase NatA) [Malassezia sympodialis ATCC 42132]|eukprot:XP_018740175.1 uncharacterized protein MSY001_1605 [Malassezia sympodialis ATCC 42132]
MPPKKVQLSPRERVLFARLIQEYENRKYKPALKTADAILSKVPEHGETLAIKGLVLFTLQQRDEGLKLAKLGVRHDLTSFICWHALGIVYRMDRNYEESLKCYAQALRIEGGNLNLVRESGFMQLQLRNYAPLIDARLVILRTQPHLRMNWVALAVAHDLADSQAQAVRVLAAYEDVSRDIPKHNYEFNEVVLYHASLLEQMGEADQLLQLLEEQKAHIVDVPAAEQLKALALCMAGRTQEAVDAWRKLLERNPENKHFIANYLDLAAETEDARLVKLLELQHSYPKSTAMRRMALHIAQGDAFTEQARDYLERALVKNVPSLFSDMKSLYQQPGKQAVIEELVEAFRLRWDPHQAEAANEPPSSYLFAMYYLAHHYSYTGRPALALTYVESMLKHTPTMPELYMTHARVLKRAGAYKAAADAMQAARHLDGQDRYLNTKAAKYLLRVNQVEEASRVLKLFTRPDVPDPVADLVEMQAIGFLVEAAEAHERRGEYALALKRFHQVDKTVQDIYDDQLDFHSYCLRKMTLRAYVRTIRFEDHVFATRDYVRAAKGAVALYVKLHDDPHREKPVPAKVEVPSELDENTPPPDMDPKGEALLATDTPLDVAHHFLRKLQLFAPQDIQTWLCTFEVAIRQNKWLLALRALSLAYRLDAAHPELHVQLIRFRQVAEAAGSMPEVAAKALASLQKDMPVLVAPVAVLQTEYLQRYGDASAAHVLGAARGLYALHGDAQAQEAAELVFSLLKRDSVPLRVLEQAHAFVRHLAERATLPPTASLTAFEQGAHALWKHAEAFLPSAAAA